MLHGSRRRCQSIGSRKPGYGDYGPQVLHFLGTYRAHVYEQDVSHTIVSYGCPLAFFLSHSLEPHTLLWVTDSLLCGSFVGRTARIRVHLRQGTASEDPIFAISCAARGRRQHSSISLAHFQALRLRAKQAPCRDTGVGGGNRDAIRPFGYSQHSTTVVPLPTQDGKDASPSFDLARSPSWL